MMPIATKHFLLNTKQDRTKHVIHTYNCTRHSPQRSVIYKYRIWKLFLVERKVSAITTHQRAARKQWLRSLQSWNDGWRGQGTRRADRRDSLRILSAATETLLSEDWSNWNQQCMELLSLFQLPLSTDNSKYREKPPRNVKQFGCLKFLLTIIQYTMILFTSTIKVSRKLTTCHCYPVLNC